MAILKCKMCGGNILFNDGEKIGTCESCGTKQTIPNINDEKKANLIDRANHFRMQNDYDKALNIYEQILVEDSNDAEIYWSIVLCRYGIEYVEDPATKKRIPTVNRVQYNSILKDSDYLKVIEICDSEQRAIYEEEANYINNVQKNILDISKKKNLMMYLYVIKKLMKKGKGLMIRFLRMIYIMSLQMMVLRFFMLELLLKIK